jgi:hypothetical protein
MMRCFVPSIVALLGTLPLLAQTSEPLTIKEQGSFFVGGEHRTISEPPAGVVAAQTGEITVKQMYVQYQIPLQGARHIPVVFVHGCCLSSKTWETTPDGRMGWSEYFVRRNRSVHLADQVSRARSGFDPSAFNAVHDGTLATPRCQEYWTQRISSRGPYFVSGQNMASASPMSNSRWSRWKSCTSR